MKPYGYCSIVLDSFAMWVARFQCTATFIVRCLVLGWLIFS